MSFKRLVESWERYVNFQGDYDKNDTTLLLLLFTVIFLKELVLELLNVPRIYLYAAVNLKRK